MARDIYSGPPEERDGQVLHLLKIAYWAWKNGSSGGGGGGGDATAANQTSGAQKTQIYDNVSGNSATVDVPGSLNPTNAALAVVDLLQKTTTQVSATKAAGESVVIPANAKEWTVSVITGTATVNGAAGCPAGFSDGSTKSNAATITIAFDTPGTGYVRYAT